MTDAPSHRRPQQRPQPPSSQGSRRGPPTPKPLTDARLLAMGQWYAERYVPTRARLLAYLLRRAAKPGAFVPESLGDMEARAAQVADRLTQAGLIDDRAWTRGRVQALQNRGKSLCAIRQDLRQKGVPADVVEASLAALAEAPGQTDLLAALRYAQRRRLGPYARTEVEREGRVQRDLAALARQGFSYDICRQILALEDRDAAEVLAQGLRHDG